MGPLTEADEISKIAFGFMGSQALFTALDQQVFTHLADGALSAEEMAERTDLHRDRAETLLTALAGMGLVTVDDGRFSNSPAAEAFLVKGAKYDFGDYIRLQVGKQMYGLMGQLGGAVSGTLSEEETGSYEQWFSDPEEARLYSESQHAGSHGPARQMTRRVDLDPLREEGGTPLFRPTLPPSRQGRCRSGTYVELRGELAHVVSKGACSHVPCLNGLLPMESSKVHSHRKFDPGSEDRPRLRPWRKALAWVVVRERQTSEPHLFIFVSPPIAFKG